MKKTIRFYLLCALVILLNGCDNWGDPYGSTSGSGVDELASVKEYETKFHHTATGSSDGGKSLVLCPGQRMDFDRCSADGITIPFHGYDKGRVSYWNMRKEPAGDIVCVKNGRSYRYRADRKMLYGTCR